jgi:predicted HTH transcriptional regulator
VVYFIETIVLTDVGIYGETLQNPAPNESRSIKMGIPTNIKTLLSGTVVEWARIEFKAGWDAAASLKTICAFANDIDNWGGGYIVIGVNEQDGKPAIPLEGLPIGQLDSIQKDMLNKCKLIQPEYLPIVEAVNYQGKLFLVVWAPGGNSRPYSAPRSMAKDNRQRAYYIRKLSSTVAPSEDELRDLFTLSNNIPFDDRVNHVAELTDLNITLIQSYLKEIGSSLFDESKTMDFVDLCKGMNIVGTLPEYIKPKEVRILPNRMEIVSHPGADRSVSIEGLQQYKVFNRRYRNRRIGEFLKELHLTEGRNTGFRKIINALEHNGSPLPVFDTDADRLSFAVTIYQHPEFVVSGVVNGVNGVINGVINGVVNPLSENEIKVLVCMQEDPSVSMKRISEMTGIPTRTVDRVIAELRRRQIIERKGSRKNGLWFIHYVD